MTEHLRTTHEIDRRSLGGVKRVRPDEIKQLRASSRAFAETARLLAGMPDDRINRVASFCRDLNNCIDPILNRMRANAYMVWIVGNRNVGGYPVPLNRIMSDFLRRRDCIKVANIRRRIPSKRMAIRNDVAPTMGRETILVFRKN